MNVIFHKVLERIWTEFPSLTGLSPSSNHGEHSKTKGTKENTFGLTFLYSVAESIRMITALLYPVMPYATAKVWAQLGLGDIEEAARNGD